MTITKLDRTEDIRQRMIRETVLAFERKFPVKMEEHKRQLKKLTRSRANVFGADVQGADLIMALHIPKPLYLALQKTVGEDIFREQKELRWFMRNFPQFTVPEKI